MMGPRSHHARISQKSSAGIFDRPAGETVPLESRHIAVELCIAGSAIQRTAQIPSDFGIGV
jgi:hypothetical protein